MSVTIITKIEDDEIIRVAETRNTIGLNGMTVVVAKEIANCSEDIQHLVFEFYNRSNTSGAAKIRINCVSKGDVEKLAEQIKAMSHLFLED